MKKTLSLLTICTMIFSLVPVSIFAEEKIEPVKASTNILLELSEASGKAFSEVVEVIKENIDFNKSCKTLGVTEEKLSEISSLVGPDKIPSQMIYIIDFKSPESSQTVSTLASNVIGGKFNLVDELSRISGRPADEVINVIKDKKSFGKSANELGLTEDQFIKLLFDVGSIKINEQINLLINDKTQN